MFFLVSEMVVHFLFVLLEEKHHSVGIALIGVVEHPVEVTFEMGHAFVDIVCV